MADSKIKGGYILLSRKIIESEIFKKPPLYLKVWVYLITKAQYREYNKLKRGQLWTSIPEIMEACSWYVGFRKVTPTKKQIFTIIDWLRNPSNPCKSRFPYEGNDERNKKETMIGTTKGTHGMLVTIVNYNVYQTPENYEGNDEGNDEILTKGTRREREGNNINKECKEYKKNNNIYSDEIKEIRSYWIEHLKDIHNAQLTDTLKDTIKAKLKKWDKDKIIEAIKNYNEVLRADYFYDSEWTLINFIKQGNGVPRFVSGLDERYNGDIYTKFLKNKNNSSSKNKGWDEL
jgi:predicted small metal-binding protein